MTETNSGLYPIGKVSEMTGVNAVTLRAWERRYDLFRPVRTAKGHRLYTATEVDRIKGILQLMEKGVPISRVNDVLNNKQVVEAVAGETADFWQSCRASMMNAIIHFDDANLETIYNEVLSLYPHDVMTRRLLMPLLEELGERWSQTNAGVAEEHFFSVYLRNKLGARLHHRNVENDGHRIILACLPGEFHEIGLLLFALAASDRGFRPLLFGANMPLPELVPVAERADIAAIIFSASIVPDQKIINELLPSVVQNVACPVFAGGKVSLDLQEQLQDIGITSLGIDIVTGTKLLQVYLHKKTR